MDDRSSIPLSFEKKVRWCVVYHSPDSGYYGGWKTSSIFYFIQKPIFQLICFDKKHLEKSLNSLTLINDLKKQKKYTKTEINSKPKIFSSLDLNFRQSQGTKTFKWNSFHYIETLDTKIDLYFFNSQFLFVLWSIFFRIEILNIWSPNSNKVNLNY